jgi:ketosteroid isomerase-like protein
MILALVVSTATFAQAPAQAPAAAQGTMPPNITLPQELARVVTDLETMYAKRDGSAADLFVEDGVEMYPNRFPVVGREEIRKAYTGSGGPLTFHAFAYAMSGDVAFILGGFSSPRNPGPPDRSKFTMTLRKNAAGRWMIKSAMNSSNLPQQPPRPPAE